MSNIINYYQILSNNVKYYQILSNVKYHPSRSPPASTNKPRDRAIIHRGCFSSIVTVEESKELITCPRLCASKGFAVAALKGVRFIADILFVCLYVCLFIYLFIYLFMYLFVYLFVYLFIYLFIYLCIYLFIYSFIYLINYLLSWNSIFDNAATCTCWKRTLRPPTALGLQPHTSIL